MVVEVESITLTVDVKEARSLVAKDRNILGKRTTSDPYVIVKSGEKVIGKSRIIHKSLFPVWNESFQHVFSFDQANAMLRNQRHKIHVQLLIYDYDKIKSDDPMGSVLIHIDPLNPPSLQWYPVGKGMGKSYCKNAKGEIQVGITVTARKILSLSRGNSHPIRYKTIDVRLSWDVENGRQVDLDASCVAIDREGEINMDETVYYGNLENANASIVHSGDDVDGSADGDDEVIRCYIQRIPENIIALYFILTVATSGKTFSAVKSAKVRITSAETNTAICNFFPSKLGDRTAMFLARLARSKHDDSKWLFTPIEDADRTARDFGSLIPEIKSYTRDLLPNIRVDPHARIAVLRKGGTIRVRDFAPKGAVPEWVTMGLAWDVTDGVNIDLDASVICLGKDLNLVDIVFFQQLRSKDKAITHGGDEREGDEAGDDEEIRLCLSRVSPAVTYIGFVINSYSGQKLDDVAKASCHIFDPLTSTDIVKYALSNSKGLKSYTALVLGCLYRIGAGDWNFRIISEPAQGRTAHDNVDELQRYLRQHPPQPPTIRPDTNVVVTRMPRSVSHVEDEIVAVPSSALRSSIW